MSADATLQPALTVQELQTYAEHCKRLVRDINFVLADQQLREAGWRIVYAVDFSEIRNYVFPAPGAEPPPFFQDGWSGRASDNVAINQFNILQHFFATQRPLVIAEPHAVELWSFYYETLPHLVLPRIANGLLQAIDSISKTLGSEDGRQIIEIAEKAEASGRALTDAEISYILDFFEQEAAHLVVFARGGELAPIDRMNALLDNGPFVDLADFIQFDIGAVDDKLVERRYEKLKQYRGKRRKPAVSFSDALAVEHIRLANQGLEKERTRILLLGRSRHIAKTLEEEAELWQPMGPIARHPRVFSQLYRQMPDPEMPALDRRKASLNLLIASAAARAKREKSAHAESTAVQSSEFDLDPKDLIEQIQNEWTVTNSLATALEKNEDMEPRTEHAATAAKLLEFLRNHRKLFDTAKERVAKLLTETTRKHEILAFHLQTDPTETGHGDVKYRFEFNDSRIAALIDRLVAKSFVSSAEATELFVTGLDSTSNYERLLAMAVSLGALGRWQLAEQAAGRAILEAEAESVSPHEGHFLKAVAIRKQKTTPRRLGLALADLDAASTERGDTGFLTTPDPRYLKEEATIKLIWSRKTLETDGEIYEDLYAPDVISGLLERALRSATDQKLKVEILNNFCYLYATPPTADTSKAQRYLAELEKTLAEWTPNRHAWPSPIRDTVTYTHFQLAPFETTELSKYEAWAKELDTIPDTDFNSDDLRWVKAHRREIHEAIAKKRGSVAAKLPL